jgi:lysophospholipase L1-like esterase
MPLDANGNLILDPVYVALVDTDIEPIQHNTPLADIAQAVSQKLDADGRKLITGTLICAPGVTIKPGKDGAGDEVPRASQIVAAQSILHMALVGDSWFWVDVASPLNSFKTAMTGALDASFGPRRWNVMNWALGGTCLSKNVSNPGYFPAIEDQVTNYIVGETDLTVVVVQGGVNDLSRGFTLGSSASAMSNEMIAATTRITNALTAEGTQFIVTECQPFGGAPFDTVATRTARDSYNAYVNSTWGPSGRVLPLYVLLNDVSNPGNILPAYILDAALDRFHINHAGKVLLANAIAALPYMVTVNATRARARSSTDLLFDLSRKGTVKTNRLIVGQDDGAAGVITARADAVGVPGLVISQYNTPLVSQTFTATDGAQLELARNSSGIKTTIAFFDPAITSFFSRLDVGTDGIIQRQTSKLFSSAATVATGFLAFSAQPIANSTITLNGLVWTFVSAAPVGNQTQIGASLAATLTALAANLNASVNAALTPATYAVSGSNLTITYDTTGQIGNTYLLVASTAPASNATVSQPSLVGGGPTGVAFDTQTVTPYNAAVTGQTVLRTAYGLGGTAFANVHTSGASHSIQVAGVEKLGVLANGAVRVPGNILQIQGIPGYASLAAAKAALDATYGIGVVFFNGTANLLDITR